VSTALPAPSGSALLSQWAWQPVAIAFGAALAGWYLFAVARARRGGVRWPVRRHLAYGLGLAMLGWTCCGFLQAYVDSMYWVWTTQVLALWLLIPGVLLAGQPVQLALTVSGRSGWVGRFLRTRLARFLANPLVGPALVPVLSAGLFFGPLPGWAVTLPVIQWLLAPALLVVGGLMLLPLVGIDEGASTLAVALTLALGSVELVLDAIPGIVLRLHHSLVSPYFQHRVMHPWSRSHLRDQQTAGAVLWIVAELIDLPFLLLMFRRWLQADARDAAAVDAVLEAERAAREALDPVAPGEAAELTDVPWWVNDPAMQRRLRGQG
jgi:cytochrome c oxidase assembly factor CtaG